ncbi:LGFP repeat-containing protein, partial [Corynebacterium glutamicum]|nr:LGFP repeat-containing protein [Corynebacterium glutamicum]MBA4592239.1 LGFP repeat-containing protein [Corynebacterium glutamicum]
MLLAIGVASPVAQAQVEDQFELVKEISDEQFADDGVDYVPNRNAPTVKEQLEDFESAHPEVVIEYHEHVNDSKDNVEELPLPKRDIVAGEMRSDVIELPEGVSKDEADQVEVAEARLNEGARLMAATGCEAMWPTGFSVCGRILDAYRQVGGQLSWLGPPKSNELTNPDGVGKRSEFVGGAIYWHPDTGAYAVTLDGLRQWGTLNWESGPLGYPTSGPMDTNYPLTQRQTFQGGDNYYNPLTGGAVWGDIKQRYEELGGSNHAIGIPIT